MQFDYNSTVISEPKYLRLFVKCLQLKPAILLRPNLKINYKELSDFHICPFSASSRQSNYVHIGLVLNIYDYMYFHYWIAGSQNEDSMPYSFLHPFIPNT